MKRILMIILVVFTLFLSSCASYDAEPQDYIIDPSFKDEITYNYNKMSFNDTPDYDILYGVTNSYYDFVLIHNNVMETDLTAEEVTAYEPLFDVFDEIIIETNKSLPDIMESSSNIFLEDSENSGITLRLEDIVAFNAFKEKFNEVQLAYRNSSFRITKLNYVEYLLDDKIDSYEEAALEFLQDKYLDYYEVSNFSSINFETRTLEEILSSFEQVIGFVPTEAELLQLETAYEIIQRLHNLE